MKTILFFTFLLTFQSLYAQINPTEVTIARDSSGTPHIFGKTDAHTAYGLAWAHAEDDFEHLQQMIAMSKGRLGEINGKGGAASDYFTQFIRAREIAEKFYDRDLTLEFQKVVSGYVQGLNSYAAQHKKDQVLKGLFPITELDILTAYTIILNGMVGTPGAIEAIRNRTPDDYKFNANLGSNGYAANQPLTQDGSAMLCANPHVPLEGLISWYEVHMHSEEGQNIHGALFPGMVSPGLGCNEHLGWGVTFNWPDYVDIYELKMHPKKKNHYAYDGEWLELEEISVPLRVKIGFFKLPLRKKAYYSVHGPVYKNKDGFYAIRNNAGFNTKAAEQWYRMGKAKNLAEYKKAIALQGIPLFNFIYADDQANIFYIFNGLLPKRTAGYDYLNVVPGDTSATVWTSFHAPEELPQVENPSCGYVYNTNNTPFRSSCETDAPNRSDFDDLSGFEWNRINNRDLAFRAIIDTVEQLDFEAFKAIKHTAYYTEDSPLRRTVLQLNQLTDSKYDSHRAFIDYMLAWDFHGNSDNKHAGAVILTFNHAFNENGGTYIDLEKGKELTPEQLFKSVKYAQKYLEKRFGTYEITLGQLQELIRGDKSYPLGGLPEALRSTYVTKQKDDRYKIVNGDSFVMYVHFKSNGNHTIETIVPYGASRNKDSEFYTNQMERYSKNETKSVTLDKEQLLEKAIKVYHPK